jgi:hypothetical protein
MMKCNHTVIVTGSYSQIVRAESRDVTGGRITCSEFVDVNGKRHEGGITGDTAGVITILFTKRN